MEARSPGSRSNVENAPRRRPVTGQQRAQTPRSQPRHIRHALPSCHRCEINSIHSNATHAPIANPPNNAQLGGIAYHSPKLHPGPCNSVGRRPRTVTRTRVTTIHFASSTTHAKCKNLCKIMKLRTETKIYRPELNVSYSRCFPY